MSKSIVPVPEETAQEIRALRTELEDLQDRERDLNEQVHLVNAKLDRRVKALAHELDIGLTGWNYNVEKGRFEGPSA